MHLRTKCTVSFVILFFISTQSLFAKHNIRLLLAAKKADFAKVEQAVKDMDGKVHIKHNLVDVMSVSLPMEKVPELSAMAEVSKIVKDDMMHKPDPIRLQKPGYDHLPGILEMEANSQKTLTSEEILSLIGETDGYYPFTNDLTGANEFISRTGHIGENVVVGIIDDGVSLAASSIASRILGGENFTGDGVPATNPISNSHGTWVAVCIGANALFGFGNPAVQDAIKTYAPNSIIPDYFGPGVDGIPMVGQAPGALFYALKVFPEGSNSAARSVIAAALERAIELKQKFNAGEADGINIQVVNMSLSGTNLFAGRDEFYSPLMDMAEKAGMVVVVSAGNGGPGGMTVGTPSDDSGVLTVAASSDATHERIVADLFYVGPGGGYLWRPVDNNIVADYSSRGPNADGRSDPDITAPGTWRFAQNANGSTINWVSGTSFSAPTVSGAAALLFSQKPNALPYQIKGALLNSANKHALDEMPGPQDQGHGFLDVDKAGKFLDWGFVYTFPQRLFSSPSVERNIERGARIRVINHPYYSTYTGWLKPGRRAEYFYNITPKTKRVTIDISNVIAQLAPEEQNQLFTDDLIVAVQSAKTGGADDYRFYNFVGSGGASITLEGSDLDYGVARITVMGDWTNAGLVASKVSIRSEYDYHFSWPSKVGKLASGESDIHQIEVGDGATSLDIKLSWLKDWGSYPTNDLDLFVYDPDGNLVLADNDADGDYDGLSLDSPEQISIANPAAGTWTIYVDGYTVWHYKEWYKLFIDVCAPPPALAKGAALESGMSLPTEFSLEQNYPNPFNPTTTINYQLPDDGFVTLKIFDIQGRVVRTLVNQDKAAGFYSAYWDGRNESGSTVPSGTYLYQIIAGNFRKSHKMVLMK